MASQLQSSPQLSPVVEVPIMTNLVRSASLEQDVIPNFRLPKSEIEVLGSLDQYMTTMSKTTSQIQSTLQTSRSLCSNKEANDESFKRLKQNLENSRETKASLEKTIHDDKAIGRQFLQEKALRKYEEYLQTWGNIGERLANKTGKPKTALVMESQDAFRAKREEIDILEASIPVEKRHNEWSWELSLRDAPEDDGVRYVKIGNYPYPLFCPIIEKRVRKPATVRNPDRFFEDKNSLGIRSMKSEYVKKKYGKLLAKELSYDPASHIEELKVVGQKIEEKYNTYDEGEIYASSHVPYEIKEEEAKDELEAPAFQLSETDILFEAIPSELVQKEVILENTGCCSIQYKWVKIEPITSLQKKRAESKFMLSTESKGILLPQRSKKFVFSFESEQEGIFSDGFKLETIPKAYCDCDEVKLKGVVISEEQQDLQPFVEKEEEKGVYIVMHDIVESVIDSLPEPIPPKDNREEMRNIKVKLLREKFIERNKHLSGSTAFTVSDDLLQAFYCLYSNAATLLNVPNTVWDYSLFSLRALVQQITNDEKRHTLLVVLLELMRVLEKEQVENIERETAKLETKIRRSIMYDQIMGAMNEFLDTAGFLEDSMISSEAAKKSNANSNAEEVKEKYISALQTQTRTILANAITRTEKQWDFHLKTNSCMLKE